ncbi:hypothetical protein VNO78_16733 [Psophocarpus tetragonolobus]|uniref:Ricin B-like lectin R40G3 n=1 Tax=Psophocarpus tetragonolobus TaxID=3891 RepID=A0AAN9SIA2_PSOTE
MSFPFNHSHHRRNDDDEDERPVAYPPPGNSYINPPYYGGPKPETHVFHTSHVSPDFDHAAPPAFHHHDAYPAPPAPDYPPPGGSTVHHVAHHNTPHSAFSSYNAPTTVHHVAHEANSSLPRRPTVRVVTKAAPNFSLTVRRGQVILAPSDPSDEYQHWYKDEKYSTRVKDEEGCPAFSLINKATREALKHSTGASHPVRLIPYNPDYLDESILWTESRDLGDGHRAIRMVNNVHLNVDAFHGDKNSGGVHDGTTIVLWDWNCGDNQQWKILPYCEFN